MDEGIRPGLKSLATRLREFAVGLGVLLAFFAFLHWRKGRPLAPWEGGLSAACLLVGWLRPTLIAPLYRLWMPVVLVLGRINTFIALALLYYLFITPYAIFLRWLGGDLLDEKMDGRSSYWKAKEPSEGPVSYTRQF
ncbi:MAG: hypothetical protein AAB320_06930 [Elusimicrobiota bacterium]